MSRSTSRLEAACGSQPPRPASEPNPDSDGDSWMGTPVLALNVVGQITRSLCGLATFWLVGRASGASTLGLLLLYLGLTAFWGRVMVFTQDRSAVRGFLASGDLSAWLSANRRGVAALAAVCFVPVLVLSTLVFVFSGNVAWPVALTLSLAVWISAGFFAFARVAAELYRADDAMWRAVGLQGITGGPWVGLVSLVAVAAVTATVDSPGPVLVIGVVSAGSIVAIGALIPARLGRSITFEGGVLRWSLSSPSVGLSELINQFGAEVPLWVVGSLFGADQLAVFGIAVRLAAPGGLLAGTVARATAIGVFRAVSSGEATRVQPRISRVYAIISAGIAGVGLCGLMLAPSAGNAFGDDGALAVQVAVVLLAASLFATLSGQPWSVLIFTEHAPEAARWNIAKIGLSVVALIAAGLVSDNLMVAAAVLVAVTVLGHLVMWAILYFRVGYDSFVWSSMRPQRSSVPA